MREYILQITRTGLSFDYEDSKEKHEFIDGCYDEAGKKFDEDPELMFRIKEVEDGETVGFIRMRTSSVMPIDCPICGKRFREHEMQMSYDCHGIPYRFICPKCWDKQMNGRGYDGEYYGAEDENY